jgi:hypothetical protein
MDIVSHRPRSASSRFSSSRRGFKLAVQQLEDRCVPANFVPFLTSVNATIAGNLVQLTVSFRDADTADPHTMVIDWKDSSPAQSVSLGVGPRHTQINHFYANHETALAKVNEIGVTITDQAFAHEVVDSSGVFDDSDFRSLAAVLGEPTRFTNLSGQFGGAVTPFNAPFGGDEILTLGQGESITVKFPVQVFDRPLSEFSGADFLVFGNSFYLFDFNTGRATGGVFAEPGQIEVSQDGVTFFPITNAFADTAFPTNGFRNPTGAFDLPPANPILSDFGRPVNLSFNEIGLTLNQIVDAYNGSGGGTPVDIASTGLQWIQYVRLHGAAGGVEVDALSVVNPMPLPSSAGDFIMAGFDQDLGLYVDATGYFQGAGANIKWVRGLANQFGNTWYFIKPDGSFFAWNGATSPQGAKQPAGALLSQLNPQVFVHPDLLTEASPATLEDADAAAARQLDETLGLFVGADGFKNGKNAPNVKWLRGAHNAFGNTWYFIRPNGDFFAWNGRKGARGALLHDFPAQLYLDPHLLHDASQATLAGAEASQAQTLDQSLGLFVDAAGFFPNVQRLNARWLRGQPNQFGNTWYFLRPTGELVAWSGRKTGRGKKVAVGAGVGQFSPQAYLDPHLIFNAAQPTLPANQVVQARQFQMTLGLFVDAAGFFPNVVNNGAKWLRGTVNAFGNTWYFLRPTGEFVAWNGHTSAGGKKFATGAVLFQFDPQVFLNPEPLL